MEAEERPSKLRKLSYDRAVASEANGAELAGQDGHNVAVPNEAADVGNLEPSDVNTASDVDLTADEERSHLNGAADEAVPAEEPLSKNQQRRIRKKQEWESKREERKVIRKEKVQQKRERKQAAKEALVAEGKPLPSKREFVVRKQLPVTIIIDCDFDDLMHDGERVSLGAQVTRSYSDNKGARFRAHLTISSFGGHMKERFDGLMAGMYKAWRGVRFFETDFVDVAQQAKSWMSEPEGGVLEGAFAKYASEDDKALMAQGEIVYLSSEADETLEELKPYSTYIIGGLVDKNREKGLCHRRATERGIRTARLPIGDYLTMSSRRVLTTNHVNEIMLKWLEHRDWGKAFITVIPQRKGGTLKNDATQDAIETREDERDEQDESAPTIAMTDTSPAYQQTEQSLQV